MKTIISLLVTTLIFISSSCAPTVVPREIDVFKIATRQLPPEETYSRLRWVRPPSGLPAKNIKAQENKNQIFLITNFDVKNMPLKEAVLVFSAPNRYKSHIKKSISNKKITLNTIGTMHEIAREIEKKANIKIIIDHRRKTVRFL